MTTISREQNIWVIIVSIIVSAIIVRIIFVFFDAAKVLAEEIFDDENDIPYDRSSYYVLNGVLVILISLFVLVLIYQWYVVGYIAKIDEGRPDDADNIVNTNPVIVASAATESSSTGFTGAPVDVGMETVDGSGSGK